MENEEIHWEADVECPSCGGTGLYKGMCEGGASAVICSDCNGTGERHIIHEYKKFIKRKIRGDVKRVYKAAVGYAITDKDVTTREGIKIPFSKRGCSYDEWLSGKQPIPIYELHCPIEHFGQWTDEGKFLENTHCIPSGLFPGGYIPNCSKINRKNCWEEFLKEYGGER